MEFNKIGILMQLPSADLTGALEQRFLVDLAEVSGCGLNEIIEARFWPGCIKFEGKIEAQAAERIQDLYELLNASKQTGPLPESLEVMRRFIETYRISQISEGISAKPINIRCGE